MTITQTVEIPADRRITLEIPREVPTGATVRVESNIIPNEKFFGQQYSCDNAGTVY